MNTIGGVSFQQACTRHPDAYPDWPVPGGHDPIALVLRPRYICCTVLRQGITSDSAGADQAISSRKGDVLRTSYDHCRQVTRHRARNFYYGLILTPASQRAALYAIYAFMRSCDDLADSVPVSDGMAGVMRVEAFRRRMSEALETGVAPTVAGDEALIWPAFLDVMRRYPIDAQCLHAMLDGQCDDLKGRHYGTFDQTRDYCYKVASTVGLVCISVWGYQGGEATRRMAEERGIALQLTNILRDLIEDHGQGRCYLPDEEFRRFGCDPQCLNQRRSGVGFDDFMTFQIERIRSYYERSNDLETWITPACRPTSWTIMQIYRALFDRIAADPRQVLRRRVALSAPAKVMIALRAQAQRRRSRRPDLPVAGGEGTGRQTGEATRSSRVGNMNPSVAGKAVVVVGGGLGGIAAAIRLADGGQNVTLVETRKRLGGRATSFVDPATGQVLDNCQHVLMGCCTHLMALYERLGVSRHIEWHRTIYFSGRDRDGHAVVDRLDADDLPAPIHLTGAIMGFKGLRLGEKLAIARGMTAIWRLGATRRRAWHDRTFAQWLAAHEQPAGAIEKFWSVVIVSALNEQIERVAADIALQVFQEGFLAHEEAYLMGLSRVPLVRLYDAARDAIAATGGRVLVGQSAEQIEIKGDSVRAVLLGNAARLADPSRRLEADACVSAVPFDRLAKIVPSEVRKKDPRLAHLDQIDVSPILGIHLWFALERDEPVMRVPHLVITEGPLQWIFNKRICSASEMFGVEGTMDLAPDTRVQHLHGVISAAHEEVTWAPKRIETMVAEQVCSVLPGARVSRMVHAAVIKEKRATFSAVPGVDAIRPRVRGRVHNLYLAGDWCDTGWPATMEGAVRSGDMAAAAVLEDGGFSVPSLPKDLPASPLYRLISG